jgi:hypothetical protein
VAYNSILGFIAFSSAGAIRQFCTFAVVVLVAHWFLAHTFSLARAVSFQHSFMNSNTDQNILLTGEKAASVDSNVNFMTGDEVAPAAPAMQRRILQCSEKDCIGCYADVPENSLNASAGGRFTDFQ